MELFARPLLLVATAIAALVTQQAPASAEAPGSELRLIRFASVGGATDAPLFLAQEYGFLKAVGMAIDIQRMGTAPALTAAIATDQLDVAGISLTPGLFASVQQQMNLRLVGDKQSLRPGFSATRFIVRSSEAKGSEDATMKALKGKKVAVSSKAASTYYLLYKLLEKHGMTLNDVQVVELAFPNMLPALTSGAVDGALSLEPFLSQAVQAKAAEVVSDLTEFVPPGGSIVPLVYSQKFATDKPAA
ncbi:MAG: NMT1/THI5-like protein, partial [Rhodospirillales bacterium]|nr:NMT1/THI5-like protein [Rhodospirillales bacterium]